MSVTSTAASVDWQIIGGAIATLIVAIGATWKGLRAGQKKVEQPNDSSLTAIVGGTLMDNLTMRALTEALHQNSQVMEDHTDCVKQQVEVMRMLERAITRQIDMDLIQSRKLDHRDHRDNPD